MSRNILANAAGSSVSVVVFLCVAPLYLAVLGAESYGLVGIFSALVAAASALDLGLSLTLNRQVARLTTVPGGDPELADVMATLQRCCWGVGLAFGALFMAASPGIAGRWLTLSLLTPDEVTHALLLMGATLPALIARTFYLAGLNGLQQQALATTVQGGATVARAIATVGSLWLVAATPAVFFLAQMAATYAEVVVLGGALLRTLPTPARGGRFRRRLLAETAGFSAGVTGTMLLALALTTVDQVILTALLPLAEFGYYALALAVAGGVAQIAYPVTTAVYPRFSQLVARGDRGPIAEDYHVFSQLVAVLVLPVAGVLVVFPGDVLALWTGNHEVARHAAAILSLRVIGTVLNTFLHVPHVLQLAFGWSSLGAAANAIALAVVAPATFVLATRHGGAGAAVAWIGLNVGGLALAMPWMHRRVLSGELGRWYLGMLLPSLAVAAVLTGSRLVMPAAAPALAALGWMAATGAVAAAAALAAAGAVRRRVSHAAAARLV